MRLGGPAAGEQRTGRVVLARDRLGIKPLYLAETPGRLRFASSLPALVRCSCSTTANIPTRWSTKSVPHWA